jgi:hypothetical protein
VPPLAIGDEHLGAVEEVFIPVSCGSGAHAGRVRAGIGPGQA